MRRNRNEMNKNLDKVVGKIQASDKEVEQFSDVMEKYKDKSPKEIEEEMNRLMNSFTRAQKDDLIRKLKILKQMAGVLSNDQMKKVDIFIKMLSR